MAYIGSRDRTTPAQSAGAYSGNVLGNALTELAQGKLGKLQQAHQAKELEDAGYDKKTAKLLSMYGNNPQVQAEAAKYKLAEPGERENSRLWSEITGQPANTQNQEQNQFESQNAPAQGNREPRLSTRNLQLLNQYRNEQKKIEQGERKIAQKERQIGQKETEFTTKQHEPMLTEYHKSLEKVPEVRAKFDRMKNLVNSGKIDFGVFAQPKLALGKASKETQELSKFIQENIADATQKANLTDQQASTLEKSMINLAQTREGAQAVMYQLNQLNELKDAQNQAIKEVLKSNNHIVPKDFAEQVAEKKQQIAGPIYRKIVAGIEGQAVQGSPVASVPKDQRPYGVGATDPKTGEKLNWDGNDWIPRAQWDRLNKGK